MHALAQAIPSTTVDEGASTSRKGRTERSAGGGGRTAVRPESGGSALAGLAAERPPPRLPSAATGENAVGSRIEPAGHEDHPHGSIDSGRMVTRMTIDTSALPDTAC